MSANPEWTGTGGVENGAPAAAGAASPGFRPSDRADCVVSPASPLQSHGAFTPGPWWVCVDDTTQVRDDEGDLVADCRRFTYTDDGEIDCPDNEANAHLIAAAPELLEAIKGLLGQVEQARDGFGIWPYRNSESMARTLEETRDAIAKARGQ